MPWDLSFLVIPHLIAHVKLVAAMRCSRLGICMYRRANDESGFCELEYPDVYILVCQVRSCSDSFEVKVEATVK